MFSPNLTRAIDATVPSGLTHIGIVLKNTQDELLVTEPHGHPYGVSATFNKVALTANESPSQALARCLQEQISGDVEALYPIPTVWATNNSRGFYFAGLFDGSVPTGSHRVSWMQPEEAHRQISASKGADSRQRDLGLLAAVADLCVSPHRRILLMVRELHRMGYEQLRAVPYLYPIAWRCPVVPAAWTLREQGVQWHGATKLMPLLADRDKRRFTYSSADRQQPFGWEGAYFASPRELAERFVHEWPQVASVGWGPDEAYLAWYTEMLEHTAPNGLFYVHGEYEEPLGDMLYATHCRVQRVPAAPPGLAERGAWDRFGERRAQHVNET
jgi:hypothetical protein